MLSFKKLNKFDSKHIFKWFEKDITIGLMRPKMRKVTQDLKFFTETAHKIKKKWKELVCACQTTPLSKSWIIIQNSEIT